MIYVNPNIRASDRDGYIIATFVADTAAELPATNYITGYTLEIGSTCHVIEDTSDYEMMSNGTWVKRKIASYDPDAYTKSQTDALVSQVQAETVANKALIVPMIDTGSKNKCTVSSGSNTLPTRWLQIPITLETGVYTVYFGDLQSTDTDATTCQFVFFDSSNAVASNYAYFERGTEKSLTLTVTATTSYCRLYPSDSYAHSESDTVTANNIMICSKDNFDASAAYEPYCPTLAELYALVKSYHP